MEPLLLICGGCGVKIRAADPERARVKPCPRCATPLAAAVEEALRLDRVRASEPPSGVSAVSLVDSIATEATRIGRELDQATAASSRRVRWVALGAAILGISSVIHWRLAPTESSPIRPVAGFVPHPTANPARPLAPPPATVQPVDAADRTPRTEPFEPPPPTPGVPLARSVAPEPPFADSASATEIMANLSVQPTDPTGVTPRVAVDTPRFPTAVGGVLPAQVPPPPEPGLLPAGSAVPLDPSNGSVEPRRLLVRDGQGTAVVAREHGTMNDQMAVVLPDGTIGWPTTRVFTDQKFVPSTIDALEQTLLAGEYRTFRVVKTQHYLVFYQCSEKFAHDSADLLEELYERLTAALRKQQLPVAEAEFPLVAVIFQTETDFRNNRKIAAEVQAYYDILSNRIFFYERGKRDRSAPEVSALRKPQTVVHEGTHQLLHNVGIQHRMSPWPIWLVEGLAEYCSPPKPTRNGGTDWAGLGQINVMHLTTIRDLDDPMSSEVRGGPQAPAGRDRSQPMVEYLVTRTDLTPTDYALSWGLTHYLARDRDRFPQFVAYIRKLNRLKPFETQTPDEQLADFRAIFGKDLNRLDAQVAKHLAKLKIPDAQALPFYAVLIEQPVSRTAVRRMAMVSQSPSVIRQWVETASNASGGQINWQALAHPTRTRAVLTADDWIQHRQ